eukprot:g130.t1
MGRIGDTISTVSAPTRAASDDSSSGSVAYRNQPWRRTISNVARRTGLVIAIFFAIASIVAASHLIALPSADAQRVDPNSPMLPSNVSYRHYVTTGTPVANVSACAYVNTTQCLIDSGASVSCFRDRDYFTNYRANTAGRLQTADGTDIDILGAGDVTLYTANGHAVTVRAVHTPRLSHDILSTTQMGRDGYQFTLGAGTESCRHPSGHREPICSTGSTPTWALSRSPPHVAVSATPVFNQEAGEWHVTRDGATVAGPFTLHDQAEQEARRINQGTHAWDQVQASKQRTAPSPQPAKRPPMKNTGAKGLQLRERRVSRLRSHANTLHRIFAHAAFEDVRGTVLAGNVHVRSELAHAVAAGATPTPNCYTCTKGNMSKTPVLTRLKREAAAYRDPPPPKATRNFQKVYCDIMVAAKPGLLWRRHKRYVVAFLDDASGYVWCTIVNQRSDVPAAVTKYVTHLHAEGLISDPGSTKMTLRTDNELDSANCARVFREHGIKPEYTAAQSPESNARIERFWRTLTSAAVRMIADAQLPMYFWDAAVEHAVRIHNALGRRSNNDGFVTPYQRAFNGRKANMMHAHIFGSIAAVHVDKMARDHKFSDRCSWGIWIGFAPDHSVSSSHLVYDVMTQRTTCKRDVKVFETEEHAETCNHDFALQLARTSDRARRMERTAAASSNLDNPFDQARDDVQHDSDMPHINAIGQICGHADITVENATDRIPAVKAQSIHDFHGYVAAAIRSLPPGATPKTYHQAMSSVERRKWSNACDDEFHGQLAAGTFAYVDATSVPDDATILPSGWTFKIKQKDGKAERYKARAHTDGSRMQPGRDYDVHHAYAPVVERSSIKTQCAIAAATGMLIGSIDIGQAFINAHNDRRHLFMRCPPGYARIGRDGKPQVLHILRSNYGMVQSGANFYRHLRDVLIQHCGFRPTVADPCVLTYSKRGMRIIVSLYVDDLLYCVDSEATRDKFVATMRREYPGFGDTEGVKHHPCRPGQHITMLGMRIHDTSRTNGEREIFIEMSDVVKAMLHDYNMHNANHARTPMSPDCVTDLSADSDNDRSEVQAYDVKGLLGRLLWISTCCRPDIAWATNYCARYAHDPSPRLWTALKRIARYLKATQWHGLCYRRNRGNSVQLEVHVDADHAGCPSTMRSTTGAIYTVNGVAIHWKSRRQPPAAKSSTDAEMVAIADCCTDIQYFRDVLKELGAPQHEPTPVHCDNAGAVRNSRYPTNKRTKHRNLQFSIVRDHVNAGQASLHDQDTVDNPAGMHTEAVGPTKIAKHRRAIGVHEPNPSIPIVA